MAALSEILIMLVRTATSLFLVAVLLRLLLQLARADFYNPISQFLVKVTNPLLKPLRRLIPGLLGIDMAAVLLAVLVQALGIAVVFLVNGLVPGVLQLLLWSLLGCVSTVVGIYFLAILANIILSWVAAGSYHPAVILLHQLTEPVMRPFRRLLPPLGGLDLSPILVFIVINILQIALRHTATAIGMPTALVLGL
ncbi:MAG TPA: YggT family protein [Spongiibacteraceae bacterium]|jgi:YggT family protein|nr:YggT family protein [Spongiibacteraceae bacterium]HUH37583.1 YggT family protein [Spongiibacteraceae bacterium]